jgi:hypothetical protein
VCLSQIPSSRRARAFAGLTERARFAPLLGGPRARACRRDRGAAREARRIPRSARGAAPSSISGGLGERRGACARGRVRIPRSARPRVAIVEPERDARLAAATRQIRRRNG